MEVIEITYSMGQTFQVAPYEPINIHYSAKAELKKGEDVMKAYDKLASIVNERCGAERLKWSKPQVAAKYLADKGKEELARQVLKKNIPFDDDVHFDAHELTGN